MDLQRKREMLANRLRREESPILRDVTYASQGRFQMGNLPTCQKDSARSDAP